MKKVNVYASVVAFLFLCFAKPVFAAFPFSDPTDYFRSAATGDWGSLSTWETSPDNGITAWVPATSTPTSAAKTIYIRNTHTVTVAGNQDMDELIIESGGILFHSANTLMVNDGAGDDIIVQAGGIFTLSSNSNGPVFSGAATANINTGAVLRLSATGLTAAGAGVHTANYIYNDASVLEYTLTNAFSTDNVTFFPNAGASTIPVFRITANVVSVGANTATIINGLFEANGNITFQNAGTKTFRNGITGTGNVNGSASGKFIINGTTAKLGGSGLLTLPATGMEIGNVTTVSMVSNKSVTGNIALLSDALVMLNTFNLTMTGDITGGSATSHIVTNSTGKLIISNITAIPRIFPVGADNSSINALAIFNGEGLNYAVLVETGINPAIGVPLSAVNKTWIVRPSGTPAGTVNVNFFYAAGDGNALFNYAPALVEQGFYTSVWNVINTGLTQFGGPLTYQVTGTVNIFAANTDAPMVLANLGAILANSNSTSVHHFTGIKQNNKHVLNWRINCGNSAQVNIEVERGNDGIHFSSIHAMYATVLRCQQPFELTDDMPAAGVNYYRIKITDADAKVFYSSIVVLLNAAAGFEMISVTPNPVVDGRINVKLTAAEKGNIQFVITDLQGRVLQNKNVHLFAGFNPVLLGASSLSPGMYYITGYISGMAKKSLRFVIQ